MTITKTNYMQMKHAIDKLPVDRNLKFTLYYCFPKLAEHMVNS
jgi:hypothetical protein